MRFTSAIFLACLLAACRDEDTGKFDTTIPTDLCENGTFPPCDSDVVDTDADADTDTDADSDTDTDTDADTDADTDTDADSDTDTDTGITDTAPPISTGVITDTAKIDTAPVRPTDTAPGDTGTIVITDTAPQTDSGTDTGPTDTR